MSRIHFSGRVAIWVACLGMVTPGQAVFAASPQHQSTKQTKGAAVQTARASQTHDIALGKGGSFTGFVVDDQGQPIDGAAVELRHGSHKPVRTVSDSQGRFVVNGLKGGLYQVAVGDTLQNVRLWAANTAPPAAKNNAVLVLGQNVVRGQDNILGGMGNGIGGLSGAQVVGGALLGAGIIAGGVYIYNENNDDDDDDPPPPMS